jgi:lipoate-protein ligase A
VSVEVSPGGWSVERVVGDADALHHADVPARRLVRFGEVAAPAAVLGSTQAGELIRSDALERSGRQLVRRRSGGGVVLLDPGRQLWCDVVIPRGDPLWDDDVERASWWVGEWWAGVIDGGAVHRSGLTDRAAGSVACFAAVGPGEVVVGDAKVVGISQRRTRELARFQTVAYLDWEAAELLDLLSPGVLSASGREALEQRVRPVGGPEEDLIGDLLGSLPS